MKELPKDIKTKLENLFPDLSEKEKATGILTNIFNRNWNIGPGQLARAVLYLSEGSLEKLKDLVNITDPRDVLMTAKKKAGISS